MKADNIKTVVKIGDNYIDLAEVKSRPNEAYNGSVMLCHASVNPNGYLYRYMPLEAFVDMLRTGMNTLTSAYIQEDKYEGGLFAIQAKFDKTEIDALVECGLSYINKSLDENNKYRPFLKELKNLYFQSWTKKENCEGMWKAYSNSGKTRIVKIKCKAGDILNSLVSNAGEDNVQKCFLCSVIYIPKDEYISEIKNIVIRDSSTISKIGAGVASDHILKRDDYKYENEVRVLYMHYLADEQEDNPTGLQINEGKCLKYKINNDAHTCCLLPIQEVVLDPWTKEYYVDSIKDMLSKYDINPEIVIRSKYFDEVLTLE